MWEGTVGAIHVAPEASAPMQSIVEVLALPGRGLETDRYLTGTGFWSKTASHGGREVTLVEFEAGEGLSGGTANAPGCEPGMELPAQHTRRPVATRVVQLNRLGGREIRVGVVP